MSSSQIHASEKVIYHTIKPNIPFSEVHIPQNNNNGCYYSELKNKVIFTLCGITCFYLHLQSTKTNKLCCENPSNQKHKLNIESWYHWKISAGFNRSHPGIYVQKKKKDKFRIIMLSGEYQVFMAIIELCRKD